ncbi:hypothetical protein CTAYLR_007092 [Chrysophaeum taylorii]|uniref:Enoyl reductase (ER) domain-containing protein n=1 Tax=Chrysophaeum taylorii TaxID=2483200 RepID=A0AAD7XSR6_9STRA|nr:hypothetical protein CTAYLR_007092 [Chrysophaeum taylorii]
MTPSLPATMRAIGYSTSLAVTEPKCLEDICMPVPTPEPRDLLVEVKAVSVNPVDVKIRVWMAPETGHKILGWDVAGVVVGVGSQVEHYAVGDKVWYAGAFSRPGCNSEYHVVDERIVGRCPANIDFGAAAALPLTTITAWEILFDCFKISKGQEGDSLLIVGAAGGVGSILIQLAKKLTKLKVIATASREETKAWVEKMGADMVINHHEDLKTQLGEEQPRYVASLVGTDKNFAAMIDIIKPRGHITIIDDPATFDVTKIAAYKFKALTFSWEFMFTRSMFETADIGAQKKLLDEVADLVDAGTISTTLTSRLGNIDAKTLIKAHEAQESGKAIGKTVLEGFPPAASDS